MDDEFDLTAERFIPREDGASFRFSGLDNLGGFSVEGFARKVGANYAAGSVPLSYSHYSGDNRAIIDFTAIRELYRQGECHVLGIWIQNGITWTFKGKLKPFDAKRIASVERRATPAHIATAAEIESIKRKLDGQSKSVNEKARRERKLREYAKRSEKGMRKSRSKAKRRDMYSKGKRIPGGAFSRRG